MWFEILLCITNNLIKHQSFVQTQLNDQIVLLQAIQVIISILFALCLNVKQFYLTLSSATTPGQIGPWSNDNEGILCIPRISIIIGTSTSDCLMSYPGLLLGKFYSSAKMQSVYLTTPADWPTG